jgi:hypothetical protein
VTDMMVPPLTTAIRLLALGWIVEASVASLPWLFNAGSRLWSWHYNAQLIWIVVSHALTAVLPFWAGALLWLKRDAAACVTLVAVAGNWLMWHVFTFVDLAWLRYDIARVLLSAFTLCVVLAYSIGRAGRAVEQCSGRATPRMEARRRSQVLGRH